MARSAPRPTLLRRLALLATLAALAGPPRAAAWSEDGHRLIGAIAEARMGAPARQLVREVIGNASLGDAAIAMWADRTRSRQTGALHFVNVPLEAGRYDAGRHCPRGACVTGAVEQAVADLEEARDAIRLADALRSLVHFVGDLHNPMHAGSPHDRGGNESWARVGRRKQPVSLHELWDKDLVRPLVPGRAIGEAARALLATVTPAQAAAWSAEPSPAAWTTETHLAAREAYRELEAHPRSGRYWLLPGDFAERHREAVARQLLAAGIRLAALLDRIADSRGRRAERR